MKIFLTLIFTITLIAGCTMSDDEKIDKIFSDYNKPDIAWSRRDGHRKWGDYIPERLRACKR